MLFERNIYKNLLAWKNRSNGHTALLIEGARRIGKSTIVEDFVKKEYDSYILINFGDSKGSFTKDVKEVFEKSQSYNEFFNNLQLVTGVRLYERKSAIVFDEVQKYIPAREMIKFLVADGRYDFLETGSLISIKKNSQKIIIPSEEESIEMFPMSFDEFLKAIGENLLLDEIIDAFNNERALNETVHKKAYKLFRTYMAVGGMPQAVKTFIETNDFGLVDIEKKSIIKLYDEDLEKISRKSSSVTPKIIYDRLQSLYSNHSFEISSTSFGKNTKLFTCLNNVDELEKSKIINVAYELKNIDPSLTLGYNLGRVKVYSGDTGLLISKMFYNKSYLENDLYKSIILDKISANEGFLFENAVAQMLRAIGYELKYNTLYKDNNRNMYSVDFIIGNGRKICPIEVKSSNYSTHASIDEFNRKYHQYINKKIIIYGKNYKKDNDYIYLPIYMTMLL